MTAQPRRRRRPAVIYYGLPLALVLLILALGWLLYSRSRAPAPNILFITVDALRADRLGPRGERPSLTPHMDALAAGGARFDQAIAQSGWTPPTMQAMLTSTYPRTHGAFFFGQRMAPGLATLPGTARSAGYQTHLISAHETTDMLPSFVEAFQSWKQMAQPAGATLTDRALAWIQAAGNERPFLLWLHYMETHESVAGSLPPKTSPTEITTAQVEAAARLYDAGVQNMDREVGRLMAGLRRLGLREDTLVVLTADHGQELCENGACLDHGSHLDDTLLRIPLVLSYPQKLDGNIRVKDQVEAVDIAPTVCRLASLPIPDGFQGQDLTPLLRGETRTPRVAVSEHRERLGDSLEKPVLWTMTSIRGGGFKLVEIRDSSRAEAAIFSLADDPLEHRPSFQESHPQFPRLIAALERWRKATPAAGERAPIKMTENARRRLTSLGYLQDVQPEERAGAPAPGAAPSAEKQTPFPWGRHQRMTRGELRPTPGAEEPREPGR